MKLKYITTIASLPSSPALSKNSREVQDARERFGDSGQAAVAGGQEGVCRSIGVYYPAVSLKVRVMDGIECLQGEPSSSQLWFLGGLWANPQRVC